MFGTKQRMKQAAQQKHVVEMARDEMAERARLRMLKKKHESLLMAVEKERQAKEDADKDRLRQKKRKAALRHDRAERKRSMEKNKKNKNNGGESSESHHNDEKEGGRDVNKTRAEKKIVDKRHEDKNNKCQNLQVVQEEH